MSFIEINTPFIIKNYLRMTLSLNQMVSIGSMTISLQNG